MPRPSPSRAGRAKAQLSPAPCWRGFFLLGGYVEHDCFRISDRYMQQSVVPTVGDSVAEKRGASAAVGVGADLIVSQKSCDLNDCLANFNTCAELVIRRGAHQVRAGQSDEMGSALHVNTAGRWS